MKENKFKNFLKNIGITLKKLFSDSEELSTEVELSGDLAVNPAEVVLSRNKYQDSLRVSTTRDHKTQSRSQAKVTEKNIDSSDKEPEL